MEINSDSYRTLSKPSNEIIFKEKKSKFYGYAFPFQNENNLKSILETLKGKHHAAGHFCYAWRIGTAQMRYRTNDDGEPNNSAGAPIYGQIQAFEVTNVLVVIARVYGGTKLGVGGLIVAYRTAARMALESASIEVKYSKDTFQIDFSYSEMDKVMRVIKQKDCEIISQKMEMNCQLIVAVRKSISDNVRNVFETLHKVSISKKSSTG